jgi:hypothetical protein
MGPNQALEQTRDSVLRYGEVVGCELLNFFVRQQEAQSQSMDVPSRVSVTTHTIGRNLVKRRVIVAVGFVLAVGWALTLGCGHSRSIRFASKEFTVAPATLRAASWIVAEHKQKSGIPFLLFSTAECPPFSLHLDFSSPSSQAGDSLVIQRAEIRYKDGTIQPLSIPRDGLRLELPRRFLSEESLPVPVSLDFPDAVMKQEPFKLVLTGSLESGRVRQSFSLSHEVTSVEESAIVTGWAALLSRRPRESYGLVVWRGEPTHP